MDHLSLEKQSSTTPMLQAENEKVVIITSHNGPVGKILLREDTILANLKGCAGCGRAHFKCGTQDLSSLCWGKNWDRSFWCPVVSLSFVFVLSLIGTIFFCFTDALNEAILSNMALRNNSIAYSMWQHPAVQPTMKVHIFNYTNWRDVQMNPELKLRVEDVGPFVYRQDIERVNIDFESEELLTFQEHNSFTFIPERSIAAEFDHITVPNLPLMGVISKVVDMGLNQLSQFPLNQGLRWVNHPDAFINLPIQRFLWGYDDTIISVARPFLSLQGKLPQFDKFGLLASKNGTLHDRLTINTGVYDHTKMNIIERFNEQVNLDYWKSPDCNNITASDGTMFPPSLLDRSTVLNVFLPNLCRRIPFHYEKDVETLDGINLLRYRMPRNVFDSPDQNPANQCYCHLDSATCPPSGVVNVTVCTMGAPAMVSFPHFYLGDPLLRSRIDGLSPDPSLHDSYLDIHPTLGIALNGKSSLQINMQVKKTPYFSAVNFLPEGLILPIAWLDVEIEDLPESIRSLVYHGTYSTAAIQLGLTVTCLVLVTVSGVCLLLLFIRRQRPKPCVTIKQVNLETNMAEF